MLDKPIFRLDDWGIDVFTGRLTGIHSSTKTRVMTSPVIKIRPFSRIAETSYTIYYLGRINKCFYQQVISSGNNLQTLEGVADMNIKSRRFGKRFSAEGKRMKYLIHQERKNRKGLPNVQFSWSTGHRHNPRPKKNRGKTGKVKFTV